MNPCRHEAALADDQEPAANLAGAAHLIRGCRAGRFRVTWCPGGLTREEVELAGCAFADLAAMLKRYNPGALGEGWNELGGEDVLYLSNPGPVFRHT